MQVLSGGGSTTSALVDLSMGPGPIVPGSTSSVLLQALFTSANPINSAQIGAAGQVGLPIFIRNSAAAQASSVQKIIPGIDPITGHAGVNYLISSPSDALSLQVIGWTDDMAVAIN